MIVASLIIGSRPGNVWKSLLPGVLVVLFFCAAGWLIAHVRRIKLPLMLADANIDISDDLDVPYARIFRSDGQYLFFVPDPGRQEEFRRLRDGLIELFNSPPAADSPAGPATSKENA
jgi:hypothetical protein